MDVTFDEKLELYRASIGCGWTERWAWGATPKEARYNLNKDLRERPVLKY